MLMEIIVDDETKLTLQGQWEKQKAVEFNQVQYVSRMGQNPSRVFIVSL